MKYYYNSLIMGLALVNSTLFPTHLDSKFIPSSPFSIIARSTCQIGINRVLSRIQAKGVPRKYVNILVAKGEANTLNFNNPTNRTDAIYVSLGYSEKSNSHDKDSCSISKMYGILNSPNLIGVTHCRKRENVLGKEVGRGFCMMVKNELANNRNK